MIGKSVFDQLSLHFKLEHLFRGIKLLTGRVTKLEQNGGGGSAEVEVYSNITKDDLGRVKLGAKIEGQKIINVAPENTMIVASTVEELAISDMSQFDVASVSVGSTAISTNFTSKTKAMSYNILNKDSNFQVFRGASETFNPKLSALKLEDNKVSLVIQKNDTNVAGFVIQGETASATEGVKIFDTENKIGMAYAGNYSEKGKENPLWIPDWGTVKAHVSENAGGAVETSNNIHTDAEGKITLGAKLNNETGTYENVATPATPVVIRGESPTGYSQFLLTPTNIVFGIATTPYEAGAGTLNLHVNGITIGDDKSIAIDKNLKGIQISDDRDSVGLFYQSNYFTEGSKKESWIPNWGSVNKTEVLIKQLETATPEQISRIKNLLGIV